MKKRILTILILIIIISILFVLPSFVNAAEVDGGVINAGVSKAVEIENGGDIHYFTFTPTETGKYRFYSEGTFDTYGYLCNSDGENITSNDDYDRSEFGNNFGIIYNLEKDTIYKLKAKMYGTEIVGTFNIQIDKIQEIDDGAISTGVTKTITFANSNEYRHATYTPTESGVYNFSFSGIKTWISFDNSTYNYSSYIKPVNLEKDHTYDLYYRASNFKTTGSTNITFEKYTQVDQGTLAVDNEYSVTNNDVNKYLRYTLTINENTIYFSSQSYNDGESTDFRLQIYDESGIIIAEKSAGIDRIRGIEPGTYEVRVFLNGSATFKIIKEKSAGTQNIILNEVKTINFTEVGQRYDFTFTPSVDGVYDFYSSYTEDNLDTYGYLFDNEGNILKGNDDSDARNFCITYYLKADTTYKFGADLYGFGTLGSTNVSIRTNTSHSHNYGSYTTDPTCTEQGYITYKCYGCGHTYIDNYMNALGHDWDEGIVTPATCTEAGYTTHHCTRCGETNVDTYVDALGHEWDEGIITPATCTEAGYTTHHCTRCPETNVDTPIDALGHTWNEGVITKNATCTENGEKIYTCTICDEKKTETIEKFGHHYEIVTKQPDQTSNGSIIEKCTVCGNVKSNTVIPNIKDINLSKNMFTYNKKVQKPTITITNLDGQTIDSSNYDVIYSNINSKKIGTYYIYITFKNDYSWIGQIEYVYQIVPKGTSISKLKSGKKAFTATWKKQTDETTGYEVQYSTDKNFISGNKIINVKKNKTTSTTAKKLKAKKKYYVRIRTYKTVNGRKIYSVWSKVKTITIKK